MHLRPILLTALLSLLSTACATNSPSPRQDTTLTTNWRFLRQDPPNAQSPNFNDSNWQPVNLPHTWNALDGQDGRNDYFRGPCWYRLLLPIQPDPTKQYFLRFEAASMVADVYLNGYPAAHHAGAFAAFCLDITPLIHPGNNLLAVRVDNSPSPDVPPYPAISPSAAASIATSISSPSIKSTSPPSTTPPPASTSHLSPSNQIPPLSAPAPSSKTIPQLTPPSTSAAQSQTLQIIKSPPPKRPSKSPPPPAPISPKT